MDETVAPCLRWTRAAVLAAVATASGTLAHLSAGGLLPGVVAMGVLLLVLVVTAARLLGRPASTLRVVVLLMAGQTFIHGALTAMSGHRGDPPLARASAGGTAQLPAPMHGMGHDHRRVGSLYDQLYGDQPVVAAGQLTVPVPVQHLLADLTGAHAPMALAHLAAAAAVGLWLAVGERALWTLVGLLGAGAVAMTRSAHLLVSSLAARAAVSLAGLVAGSVVSVREALAALATPARPRPRTLALSRCVVRRGPPALLAA